MYFSVAIPLKCVFVFTALHCMQRGLSDEHLSIRLSVRPSVKCVNCDKTKTPSEKSSIMTNRKSPTRFPMSLRWTAYVAPNPHPPKGASKTTIFFVFRTENWTFLEESLLQSFFVWKLSVHKWLVGNVPFYLKFSTNVTHPLLKRRFPVYIRS